MLSHLYKVMKEDVCHRLQVSAAVRMRIQMLQPRKAQQELAENFELFRGKKEIKTFSINPLKIHVLNVPRAVEKEEPLSLRWSGKEHC